MVTRRLALLLAPLAACGADATFAPVIDTPAASSPAYPFTRLDELELSVARAGDPDALVSATFARGATVELAGVPYDSDLVVHMSGQIAGKEDAYGRTCTFDLAADAAAPTPHLYFARNVKWALSRTPAITSRTGGFAWRAADGSGVFVAGDDGGGPVVAVERFDPRLGEFTSIDPIAARVGAAFGTFGGGRGLLVGGTEPGTTTAVGALEAIDPLADAGQQVERVDDERLARTGAAVTELSDGKAVVIGGRDATGALASNVVDVADANGALVISTRRATLATPREGATLTRLSDDTGAPVAVIGGLDETGAPVATAELYKPLTEEFANPSVFHPAMVVPRSRHQAVRMPDGSVLVIGGVDGDGNAVRTLELFSPDVGFRAFGALPTEAGLIDTSATTLPDGRILLAGGRATVDGPPVTRAYFIQLDQDGTLDVGGTDSLAIPRAGQAAVTMCDGTVMLVGGASGAAAERYNPPAKDRR